MKLKEKQKKILRIVGVILLWIFIITEIPKIYVDVYNFRQLWKVRNVLDNLDGNSYKFDNVKQFNERFNSNVEPIKNCYFLSERNWYFKDDNWGGGYIFWFKLESSIFKLIYLTKYYAYPEYNLPVGEVCVMWWWCHDHNIGEFRYVIIIFYRIISKILKCLHETKMK